MKVLQKEFIMQNAFIYTNRACNITISFFKHGPEINPYLIFRFDCRQINDLVTFRSGENKREHLVIAACNDGYLKVFSPQKGNLIKVIKGISGNPICLDVSGLGHLPALGEPRDILAVGYEDDSFIVYSMLRDFQPIYRGVGHRAFIGTIRFDNYFMDAQMQYREHLVP